MSTILREERLRFGETLPRPLCVVIATALIQYYRYYEFEVQTNGFMKVGWMDVSSLAGISLGQDELSYGFDGSLIVFACSENALLFAGFLAKKWHNGGDAYGRRWKPGNVIGCFLDLNDKTICKFAR